MGKSYIYEHYGNRYSGFVVGRSCNRCLESNTNDGYISIYSCHDDFSFVPMLSLFNTTIAKIAKFIYTEQVGLMIGRVNNLQLEAENICIVIVNMLIAVILFIAAYKKCGL